MPYMSYKSNKSYCPFHRISAAPQNTIHTAQPSLINSEINSDYWATSSTVRNTVIYANFDTTYLAGVWCL